MALKILKAGVVHFCLFLQQRLQTVPLNSLKKKHWMNSMFLFLGFLLTCIINHMYFFLLLKISFHTHSHIFLIFSKPFILNKNINTLSVLRMSLKRINSKIIMFYKHMPYPKHMVDKRKTVTRYSRGAGSNNYKLLK